MGRRMVWRPGKLALLRRVDEARRAQAPPAKRPRQGFDSEYGGDDSGPEGPGPADDWEDVFDTDGLAVSLESPDFNAKRAE